MQKLNWNAYPNFSVNEFSEDPDKYASPRILDALQCARTELGVSIYPSPAPGALARFDDRSYRSMHYCNLYKGIQAKAVDFFVEGNPVDVFHKLVMSHAFRRIGVYFDTHFAGKSWVMFHGDLDYTNPTKLWYRDTAGHYHFPVWENGRGGDWLTFLTCLEQQVYVFNKK